MDDTQTIQLPQSGLAEDILAQFVTSAQAELNSAAAAPAKAAGEETFHLVTFRLAREEYGVEIGRVQEIIRAIDITQVPGAPAHVQGVINLRGRIIPVIDLRKRFGLAEVPLTDRHRIIVVELGEKRLGMMVDSVSKVVRFASTLLEELPEEATTVDQHYIRGVGKLDDRLIILLDLHRALLAQGAGVPA
jgi:purine-binding chemotaxis protein CheW